MGNLGLVKVEQLATENPWKVRIGQSGIAGDRESMGKLGLVKSGTAGDRECMENLGLVKVEQLETENPWES